MNFGFSEYAEGNFVKMLVQKYSKRVRVGGCSIFKNPAVFMRAGYKCKSLKLVFLH